ncbi:MAG: DUF2284 domain-containing protein [Clostridiales bacterium]|nr:DUF2284 domain-containing protein [Clostridiales bacterium]
MTIQEAIAQEKNKLGIHEYGFVKTEDLVVSKGVRKLCEDNVCGCYGKTWACPPGVGALEECEKKMKAYENVFVFTTKHELEDSFDWEGMISGKQEHEKMEPAVVELFREHFEHMMVLSTEGCARCENCTYPEEPCRFPDKLHPSIESYGVEVNRLAKTAGIHYINGKDTVTYFSCIFF